MLLSFLKNKLVLWGLLALPAVPMLLTLLSGGVDDEGRSAVEGLLHPTGEFAARFMIIAMIATPLRLLFPRAGFARWLIANRRAFGVAAFAFGLFHTVLYIVDMGGLAPMVAELTSLGIWTGWLAMLIFVPLGLTSHDQAVKALGTAWKKLQRLVYPAAVATLVHWLFVHNNVGSALVHFIPLAGLVAYRIWHGFVKPKLINQGETP